MRWLMIGTSATAPASLEQLAGERFDKRITCNGGLGLCPDPDVYVAIDQVAIGLHAKAARAAQAGGSWLVTRAEPSLLHLERKGCEWFDEFITIGQGPPTAETWGPGGLTGPLVLEYALRHGASEVVIVGCDGYRGRGDYWPGHPPTRTRDGRGLTARALVPGFELRARAWPEVPIVQHGQPTFAISSPNWEVRQCAPHA